MKALKLVPITEENREDVLGLQVAESQADWIETVEESLDEVANPAKNCRWKALGIYADRVPVGFAVVGRWRDATGQQPDEVWLDRLLIDQAHQGKGYGWQSAVQLIDLLQEEYACSCVYLSVFEDNQPATRLYRKLGFSFTGKRDRNGERIMVFELREKE